MIRRCSSGSALLTAYYLPPPVQSQLWCMHKCAAFVLFGVYNVQYLPQNCYKSDVLFILYAK